MRLTHESPRARWTIMAAAWALVATLLTLHTFAVRDYLALVDLQGLRGAPAATTPLQRTLPLVYADAQLWVLNALDLQERGGARVRFTATDNAPFGREVHWSSPLVWIVAGAGHLRHLLTDEPLTLATERAVGWINFALLGTLLVALSAWAAHRAGAGAGLLVAVGMIGHRDFYDAFSPNYVDHHGLITAAAFGLVLGAVFMGGGWWRADPAHRPVLLLPNSRADVRRAAVVSALCGAVGLWLSAASTIPAIAFTAAAALATVAWRGRAAQAHGAAFDAAAWRLWGRVGALASVFFYLLEYAPSHFGLRLEVNHPLYALAWWGGAEFVARLGERHLAPAAARAFPLRRWFVPALAVVAAPCALLLGGTAVFAVRDPFVGRLSHHVLEGMSLPALVRATGWDIFFLHVNATLLPALAAAGLLWARGTRDRLALTFAAVATAGFVALACWQIRFWQNSSGPQLCLTLVVLAALTQDWGARARWLLVLGTTVGLFVPPTLTRVLALHETVRQRTAGRLDLAPALHRDIAAALRASQPTGDIVLLGCPSTSSGVGYYGRFKTVGTLYWENFTGLRAAAEIFSATTAAEARTLMRARQVTHIALTSDEDFLRDYFVLLHPGAPPADFEKTFGHQLFVQQQLPVWLRVLPYRPAPDLHRPGTRVLLLQVVPDQSDAEALYHIAAAQLANGDAPHAEQNLLAALDRTPAAARAEFGLNAGNLCYQAGARAAAARLYRAGLLHGGNATLATNLAWLLATDPAATVRHGADALALAERIAAARPDDFSSANVLAAALAENGRYPEAVVAATRALALAAAARDPAVTAPLARRLAAYQAGRPWRQ